jgi:hypothetical protein
MDSIRYVDPVQGTAAARTVAPYVFAQQTGRGEAPLPSDKNVVRIYFGRRRIL